MSITRTAALAASDKRFLHETFFIGGSYRDQTRANLYRRHLTQSSNLNMRLLKIRSSLSPT
ncbi:hypothetical protein RSSM_06859 [Rhodopirellula sallentina SM41]|uniref:Uncharacterized protein n=1 Tax=Rhodopirellula sallentina SM41 TaxID=1263870 RepID=M5TRC2_9BACT|nr:hypothetical protein RSSM_06859 [Rhodopirellula sallentina SM41]